MDKPDLWIPPSYFEQEEARTNVYTVEVNGYERYVHESKIAELKDCYAKECSKHDELKGAYQKLFHSLAHVELYKIEAEIAALKTDYGLLKLALDGKIQLLESCEQALEERNTKVEELKAKLKIAKEALVYLDTQFKLERSYCPICGHGEPTDGCDNHIVVREALAQIEEP